MPYSVVNRVKYAYINKMSKIPPGFWTSAQGFAKSTKPCGTSYILGFAKGKTLRKALSR